MPSELDEFNEQPECNPIGTDGDSADWGVNILSKYGSNAIILDLLRGTEIQDFHPKSPVLKLLTTKNY